MKILFNPSYEASEQVRFDYFKKEILKLSEGRGSLKLLDVGCSQLDFSDRSKNIETFGIDINKSEYYDDNHFKLCNLDKEGIPYDDGSFDIVVAGEVAEHVKRPFEMIEEIARVLKNGGHLFLSTPNPYYYLEILKEVIGSNKLDDEEHLNLFSRIHINAYLKKNGFELLEVKRYKFWIPFIKLMVLSLRTPRLFNYQTIYKLKINKYK